MSIIFTNLVWLGLIALVAVPILVHLFARSKPPSYSFSDNRFLRLILKKTARFQKPQDWIILLLRSLAVLAILLVFLKPLLVSLGDDVKIGAKKSLVLVVDRSASMAASEGGVTRFDRALEEAHKVIDEGNYDLVNLVWIDSSPNAIFPELGGNVDYLTQALREAKPSYENGSIESAMKLAVAQSELAKGDRRIVLISDFQKEAWTSAALNVPKGIRLELLSVSKDDVSNVAVSAIRAIPSQPILGELVELVADVENFSSEDRRVKVVIESGGGRSTKEVDVPAWSRTQVRHSIEVTTAGDMPISAHLEEDGFPADDHSYSIISVRDRLRIGVVGAQVPLGLQKLGYALPWLEVVKIASVSQGSVYDYVFLNQWEGASVEQIQQLLEVNVTVLVDPSYRVKSASMRELLKLDDVGSLAVQDSEDGWKVSTQSDSHAAMKLFSTGEYGMPGEGLHRNRLAWKKGILEPLISYSDGTPALLRSSSGKGALLVSNMSFVREHSDWTERTAFVTFMAELLLAERNTKGSKFSTLPGAPIGLYPPHGLDQHSVKLSIEDKEISLTSVQTEQGLQLMTEPVVAPGVYKWKSGDDVLSVATVNMVTSESDLRTMDPQELDIGDVVTSSQLELRASLGDGLELWPICIALAFCFLIMELVVAYLKPKGKETV